MMSNSVPLLVLFIVCSTPALGQEPPKWVNNPPTQQGENAVFVGTGTSASGDSAAAKAAAWSEAMNQIMSYVGIKISETTEMEITSGYDTNADRFRRSVVSESSNQISSLKVGATFEKKTGTTLTTSMLVLYRLTDLEAEKRRVAALFKELNEAVDRPEKDADGLVAQGRVYDAVGRYLEAARVALNPAIENATIRFERNLSKARQVVQSLRLEVVAGTAKATVGRPLDSAFTVRLVRGSSAVPVPGAAIQFSLKVPMEGRITTVSSTSLTDDQGLARFEAPVPTAAGNLSLSAKLASTTLLDPLQSPLADQSLVDALSFDFDEARATWTYTVQGEAVAKVAVEGLFLVLRKNGAPYLGQEAWVSLAEKLSRAGPIASMLAGPDPRTLTGSDQTKVLATLRKALKPSSFGLFYGVVKEVEVDNAAGLFSVKVEGTVHWARPNSDPIWTTLQVGKGTGSTLEVALGSALRSFGEAAATALIAPIQDSKRNAP